MLIEPGAEKLITQMGRRMKTVGQGRPAVLLDLVYFAAANLSREDLESLA